MINNLNDSTTVVYSKERIDNNHHLGADLGPIDLFVNGNAPTHKDVELASFTEMSEVFRTAVVNDTAYPVLIFVVGEQMVAWYDEENEYGYIA
jgi:hypothetical protein